MKNTKLKSHLAYSLLMAGLLITASKPALAAVTVNSPSDVKAITDIETKIAGATSMDQIIHYYAPTATVMDYVSPGLYVGRQQIYHGFQDQLSQAKTIKPKILEINVASDGQFACDALELHFDYVMKNGQAGTMEMRQLDTFRKINGNWSITQQHISAATDPKTLNTLITGPLPVRGLVDWPDFQSGPAVSAAEGKTGVRQWVDKVLRVIGIKAALDAFGPGDTALLYGEFQPGNVRGQQEIGNYYGPIYNTFTSIDVTSPVLVTDSDGLLGAQIDNQDIVLHLKDGKTRNISLRQSDCLHIVNGQWYTFFEMVSFPMDPKTGKAVMLNEKDFK